VNTVAPETEDLYRELIADHAKNPRNSRDLPDADHHADGHNRTCGDQLTIWLKLSEDRITDISCKSSGCSISTASGSLLTEAIRGRTMEEARLLFNRFHTMLTTPLEQPTCTDELGKLAAFAGVRRFPIRVKCATLPWHTLMAALETKER
jgi:nitrogen fixation NifU-like protein